MSNLRSSLAPMAGAMREPDPANARRAARAAWRDRGFVAIDPAWLGEWDRQQLIILADKVHGKRPPRPG